MASAPTSAIAPTGLSPKARRAWEFLGEHERRMAERWGGLREYRCTECRRLMFEYIPPIRMVAQRCQFCRHWQWLTTTEPQ